VYTKQGSPVRRRRHTAEFKAKVVQDGTRVGVSIAATALAHGINANLLRRWIQEDAAKVMVAPSEEEFVAVPLLTAPANADAPAAEIRIELRRGPTTVTVTWPAHAAAECAVWLREWLR
jgi:transposase